MEYLKNLANKFDLMDMKQNIKHIKEHSSKTGHSKKKTDHILGHEEKAH